jgi:hypothetical protein
MALRLAATASALLAIPLALINWIQINEDAYVSGRSSDVVISGGDGYLIALLAAMVVIARVARTFARRLDRAFPWVCIICGLGITLISGRVLFEDWAGDRMWTIYTLLGLGIAIAVCGAVLLSGQNMGEGSDGAAGGETESVDDSRR